MMEDFSMPDIVGQIQKRYIEAREELIAKTIIDISRGVYKSYAEYIKKMKELKEICEKKNNEWNPTKYELNINILLEPFIVTERLFYIIKNY